MNPDPACPTCGERTWEVVGRRAFSRAELASCPANRRESLQVLFELWLPDVEPVQIEDIVCEACGLVIYRPRPTQKQLAAKYEKLHGSQSQAAGHELTLTERKRSRELCDYLLRHGVRLEAARILDYGGFRGALMNDLARAGANCHVLDYASDALPGISKLGSTLEDLPASASFDVIICSHVLEHVTDPRELCAGLLRHLSDDGVMYVEVPLELLGHSPRAREPVTHINFFAVPSMRATLVLAGLEPVRLELAAVTVGSGRQRLVVRGIARRAKRLAEPHKPLGQGRAVIGLVKASRFNRAILRLKYTRLLWNACDEARTTLLDKLRRFQQPTRRA